MNNTALCITVYKNRCDEMLKLISHIDKNIDVFIIAQTNDMSINEYYQYAEFNKVLIPSVTSIFQKREYIRNEMILRGYQGFFMLDDDIKAFKKITAKTKRSSSNSYSYEHTDINEILVKMIEVSNDNDCGFVSLVLPHYLGLQCPNKININKSINCCQFVYIKTEPLKKFNIHYDITGKLNEDVDVVLQLLQHGVNCATICDYSYIPTNYFYNDTHLKRTTIYDDITSIEKMHMNKTLKYHCGIKLNKKGILINTVKFKKYFNTFELPTIDDNILKYCENEDIQGLKLYLKKR